MAEYKRPEFKSMSEERRFEFMTKNKRLGSCPNCGGTIWESDQKNPLIFQCAKCDDVIAERDIIPF